MKHFEIGHDVMLTKEYKSIVLTQDEQCYKYSGFELGELFKIMTSEKHGFILENSSGRFFFSDDFMQEYFDIKTDVGNNLKTILINNNNKAFAIANNAIYFNDRSDYLKALYDVCNALNPKLNESLIGSKYIEDVNYLQ
jgi:hypothetical protein